MRIDMTVINLVLVIALKFSVMFPGYSSFVLDHYLHPESEISVDFQEDEFNRSRACYAAIVHLSQKGVENIQICEVMRIEAPLSGYLVDSRGVWDSGDGQVMTIFRTGILDGSEYEHELGEQFVFLAGGFGEDGSIILFPEAFPHEDFVYEYEFLLDSERFFELPERFPNN